MKLATQRPVTCTRMQRKTLVVFKEPDDYLCQTFRWNPAKQGSQTSLLSSYSSGTDQGAWAGSGIEGENVHSVTWCLPHWFPYSTSSHGTVRGQSRKILFRRILHVEMRTLEGNQKHRSIPVNNSCKLFSSKFTGQLVISLHRIIRPPPGVISPLPP